MSNTNPIQAELVSRSGDGRNAQLIVRSGAYRGTHHTRYRGTSHCGKKLEFLGKADEKTGAQLRFQVEVSQ